MKPTSVLLTLAIFTASTLLRAADPPQWETAATLQIDGLDISLSKPRLVTRGSGHLWFPTMTNSIWVVKVSWKQR